MSLAHGRALQALPERLQIQERLEGRDLGLWQVPSGLFCGGNLVLADLPLLWGWGHGIRALGDLVLGKRPRRAKPPADLQAAGILRTVPPFVRSGKG